MKTKLHFRRFEFKYLMKKDTADKIIPALMQYMDLDPYIVDSGKNYYTINSLYYDTSGFGCYREKIAGTSKRKKFRLRYYNTLKSDSYVFIEIKRKVDSVVIKDRVQLSQDETKDIFVNNNYSKYLNRGDDATLNEFVWAKLMNSMTPKVNVKYDRRPLVAKCDNKFRVTFDYNLRASKTDWLTGQEYSEKEVMPGYLVLELKYNDFLPIWFYDIIKKFNLQRVAFSKYCNCLEKVNPKLTP